MSFPPRSQSKVSDISETIDVIEFESRVIMVIAISRSPVLMPSFESIAAIIKVNAAAAANITPRAGNKTFALRSKPFARVSIR